MADSFKIQKLAGTRIRYMICPVCQMEIKVDDSQIRGGSQACNMRLRADMARHLKSDHPDSRFTRLFTTDADPVGARSGVDEAAVRGIVRTMLAEQAAPEVDREMLHDIVIEELKKNRPQELIIRHADGAKKLKMVARIKTSHAMLRDALEAIDMGFNNLLLVGPAGSGKTTLARQLAEALKLSFGAISLAGGTTEGALLGRPTSTGDYMPSLFVKIFEEGGIFLLDEVDGADPNVLLVLNMALDNGFLSVTARSKKPIAHRHERCIVVAAGNTFGTGADAQYVGRNQLDAAFLSRFAGAVLDVQYDSGLEMQLTTPEWYEEFTRVRAAANTARLRRILGTRELLAGQKLVRGGCDRTKVWARLTAGWTADERRKAQVPMGGN